jgi:pyruvate/2-oxoglutarate dehydrogenase complex dihydrolipoamide dehydrogenase (E3) component
VSRSVVVPPPDAHNEELVRNVHPPGWKNPAPRGPYDLAVVGAGTAGLVTSLVAASLGARVALVERHLLGGDCLNVGCVPSKSLIRAARLVQEARSAAAAGLLPPPGAEPDFGAAMERVRAIRARISHEDAASRYRDEFGVDVHLGNARFTGDGVLDVDGAPLRFRKAVVATGARAAAPPIPGLVEAGYLDNETVFSLTERPRRLAVIGAGPIGCELAQAFRRLGAEVVLLERGEQVLPREDRDAAGVVQAALLRDGVRLVLGARVERVERRDGAKVLRLGAGPGGAPGETCEVDEILVGAGRAPNVEDLGLEAVGVDYERGSGVRVDDRLRTTNRRIFAAGDVCMAWKFTHAADAAAKLVVQNALFLGRKRLSDLVIPWCTYTDPEVAHVGLSEREADERGIAIDTFSVPMAKTNRAVTDGQEEGFARIHVAKGRDRILGATVVAAHAGELITPVTLAMRHRIGLGAFTQLVFPYPTQAEALRFAAGLYTRGRLTPTVRRWFERWFALGRRLGA